MGLQTITIKQEVDNESQISSDAIQLNSSGGGVGLSQTSLRQRYRFNVVTALLDRAEKETLLGFIKFHGGHTPFWFDGGEAGDIQNKVLVGFGTGAQQDFFLPNDNIVNGSVTVYEDGIAQPAMTVTDATGLVSFTSAPALDVKIEAIYQCLFKVHYLNNTLRVRQKFVNHYRLRFALQEMGN